MYMNSVRMIRIHGRQYHPTIRPFFEMCVRDPLAYEIKEWLDESCDLVKVIANLDDNRKRTIGPPHSLVNYSASQSANDEWS